MTPSLTGIGELTEFFDVNRSWRSQAHAAASRMLRDPVVCAATFVLMLLVLVAIFGPLLAPYDPAAVNPFHTLAGPSTGHLLGLDENGRDVLSRLILGARISLSVALIAVGIAAVIGVPLGLLSGNFGGLVDSAVMRMMDTLMAFPALILALGIIALLGAGIVQIMIAIGITSVPVYARIIRAEVMALRSTEFVTAGRAIGASDARIMLRYLLPNVMPSIIVQSSLGMAYAILAEAGLSFLGLGVQPPTPSWGGMLQTAVRFMHLSPWLAVFPGLAIFIVVLAFNLCGDALRDAFDPRLRGSR